MNLFEIILHFLWRNVKLRTLIETDDLALRDNHLESVRVWISNVLDYAHRNINDGPIVSTRKELKLIASRRWNSATVGLPVLICPDLSFNFYLHRFSGENQ